MHVDPAATLSASHGAMEFLSEKAWEDLLDAITAGMVVPVIGPSLVVIRDPATGDQLPLYEYLAPRLALQLGVPEPMRFRSIAAVARAHLLRPGAKPISVHAKLMGMFRELDLTPGAALTELARIADFDLYLSTTADPLMAQALYRERPLFDLQENVTRFVPNGFSGGQCDLPERAGPGPQLYHLLGDATSKDFAVWDEDYMEFVCALIEKREHLKTLFHQLADRSLLLLGAPADDWIVRFLLRTACGRPLSRETTTHYIADADMHADEPLVFFVQAAMKPTLVIHGEPGNFALALAARWRERARATMDDSCFIEQLPERMHRNSVFISYAHEDLVVAAQIAKALLASGVQVWLDKLRLQSGDRYNDALETAIKHDCGFFISLISPSTEADHAHARFVHKERDWAAQRQTAGAVFYLPVAVALEPDQWPQHEPAAIRFSNDDSGTRPMHLYRYDPATLKGFAKHVRNLADTLLHGGTQPRR